MAGKKDKHKENVFRYGLLVICISVLLFVAVRLIALPERMGFGSDAGRDFLTVLTMVQTKVPKLIGPPSEYSLHGRQFYFGPAPYYVILPALVISHGDPLVVSYFLIGLNALIFFITLSVLGKTIRSPVTVTCFALLCIMTPAVVTYTRSYWNPHFMFAISMLLLTLLIKRTFFNNQLYFFTIGLLFGVGIQFHYAFIFAVAVSMIWMIVERQLSVRVCCFLAGGLVIGILPLVLFELRSNFYNTRTFVAVMTNLDNTHTPFVPHTFYFISLIPFAFFVVSHALGYIHGRYRILPYAILVLYIIAAIAKTVLPVDEPLPYASVTEMADIIAHDRPENFNVVDQLTRDNRAMSLRYLVTIRGYTPRAVDDYSQSQILYVYTDTPLAQLLDHPVYEMQSVTPIHTIGVWHTKNGITLYKLMKE